MIRKLVLLITLLSMQGMFAVYAGNNIMQLNDVTAQAGENITLGLDVINEDQFVAFQVDIPLPEGFGYVTGSISPNPARSNGHFAQANILPNTNIFRAIGFSLTNAAYLGNSGPIVFFTFSTPQTSGTFDLVLQNAILGNIQGQNILTGTNNGSVTLIGTSYNVNFILKDPDQNPVAGATVTLGSVTNPAGNYTFTDVDPGTYEWEVVKEGYNTANGSVTVVNQDVDVNVTMTPVVTSNVMMVLDATGEAGDDIIIDLEIVNDESFVGFQFDIPLPVGFGYVDGSIALNPARKADHLIDANILPNTNIFRALSFSLTNAAYLGNSGVIASFTFTTPDVAGVYSLNLENAIIGNIQGENIITGTTNGTLTLEEGSATAENIMIVYDATAEIGENVTIELEIVNDDDFVGFMHDISMPAGFGFLAGVLNPARITDHILDAGYVINTNIFRSLAYSENNEFFLGNSGVIATYTFSTPNTPGVFPLILEECIIADEDFENIITGTVNGTLTITAPTSFTVTFIVEDENQVAIPDATVTLGTITNPAGNYVFPNTDIGTYEWEVVKEGYVTANGSVEVVDQNVNVNVTLTEIPHENIMKVLDVTATSGTNVVVEVEVINQDNFCAFQFDIPLPAGFGYVPNSIHLNPARITNHQVMANVLPNTNVFRAVAFSLTNANFLGNDGVLTYFTFTTPTVPGNYTLNIENAILGTTSGANILSGVVGGTVTVEGSVPGENIMKILDVTADAGSDVNIDLEILNDDVFVGFQLDVPMPVGFGYVTGSIALNPARITDHLILANVLSNTNIFRILSYSTTNAAYIGNSGIIASFAFSTPDIAGVYPLTIENAIIGNAQGDNILTETVDGMVTLEEVIIPTGNIMKLHNVTATAGDNIDLDLEILNDDEFVGFQHDIPLPSGFGYVDGSAVLNPARAADHSIMANVLPNTNIFRALSFSVTNSIFLGNSGIIATYTLTTPTTAGMYNMDIENAIIGDINAQNIITGVINGTVTLTALPGYTVTFDIRDQNQQPIADATVTLGNITNPTGNYVFANIPFGSYNWMVVKSGYQIETGQVTVVSNITIPVTMTPIQVTGNIMKVLDVTAEIGEDVIINIEVINEDAFCAFQFDIPLPAGFGYTPNSIFLNPARIVNHQVMANILPNTNIFRAVAFSMTNANFLGNDGVLTYFTFTTPMVPGIYTLSIENAILGNVQGQNILDEIINGTVILEGEVPEGNVMILHDATAVVGENVEMNLEITNQDEFVGFQHDIPLPAGFGFAGSAVLNPARIVDHAIQANILPNTNIFRAISFSLTNAAYLGNSGIIATYTFTTPTTAGVYNMNLENAIIGDINAQNIITGVVNGTVTLDPIQGYTVTFVIKDPNQQPIAGATVTLGSVTNPAGNYVFPNIAPGTYNWTISKSGYETETGIVTVVGSNVTVHVTMTPIQVTGNIMKVLDATAVAGDNVVINIEVINEDAFCAFQFDIPLPADFGYVPNSIFLNPARIVNHQVMANVLPNTNIFRAVAFSMTNANFLGNDGVLTYFTFSTPEVPGVYALNIENAILGNVQGQNILDETINGTVTLTPGALYTVTFDIKDPNQQPIAGATVTLGSVTNPAGNYVFPNIAPGTYNWTISKSGYETETGIVTVVGSNVTVHVTMTPVQVTGNIMKVLDATAVAGDNVVINIEVINEDAFCAFQFDIPLPADFGYVPNSIFLNPARIVNHQVMANVLPNTNIFRAVAFSMTNANFLGNDGVLTYFTFSTPEVPGVYALNIENAILGNVQGQNILDETIDGTVTLTPGALYTVTFDIKDPNQQPIAGATVTLGSVTNPAGNYVFPNIAPGTYNWTISKSGYETETGIVTVVGSNVTVHVTMTPIQVTGNIMKVFDATAVAGDNVVINIEVINEDAFCAFQFDIPLPTGFGYVPNSIYLNPARIVNHQVMANVLPNTNIFRAVAFSMTNANFLGNDGVITYFTFSTPEVPGVYTLNIENGILGNVQGQNILDETVSGTVTLTQVPGYTVTFVIKDQNQQPIPGATVTLGAITNPAGNYVFPNTLPGTYNWMVVKSGYETETGIVTVVGSNVVVTVTMTPIQITGNIMKVLDITAEAGDDVVVEIEVINEDDFCAFQFDIPLPTGFGYVPNSIHLNPARIVNHQVMANVLPNTNIFRAVAFSMTNANFLGNDGVLTYFTFSTPEVPGVYTLNIENGILGNVQGQNILDETIDGTVTLTSGALYTVTFVIKDPNQQPIAGATVTLGSVTNPAGNYVFPNIAPGTYNWTVSKSGYETVTGVVNVVDGNVTVPVTMTPIQVTGNIMKVLDVTAEIGEDVIINIEVINEDAFCAFQFDIPLPTGFGYVPNSIHLNPARIVNHQVMANVLPNTNIFRAVAFSMTNANFLGNSGVLTYFTFTTPMVPGIYTLSIENAILGNVQGQNILDEVINGTVTLEGEIPVGNVMKLHDATAVAGENVQMNLEIINQDAFVGFQHDIPLPAGFGYVAGSAVLNPARITDHQIQANVLPNTNIFRAISFSFTNAAYLGNSGIIATYTFTTPTTAGVYNMNLEDAIIGDINAQNIITGVVNGTVTLTQVPGYTVTFVIKDQNQQPIPGATVTLGAITNPAGNYVFPNTLPGTYNWMVVKSGYETETGSVTVVGSNVVVTVTMTPIQIEGNVMKVLDVTVIAGDDALINIEVINEDAFCAFQFDIPLPAGFGYVPNSIHLNPARIVNHQVMANVLPNTNIFRAVAFSMTNANFLGNDGVLTYFTFTTPEVPGVYTLNIENGILGNVQGQNILDETISGTVTLISGALYTVTFDVKDQNQQPIPGATVTLGSVTNPAGNYVFPNIAPGTYGWVVTKSGYETVTGAVTVVDGDVTVPVTMIPIQVSGNIMKVLDATAVAGDNVVINIEVINEDNFCAFQFDIPLPTGFGYVPNSIYLNPARIVNHQVMANVLPNTNIFRAVAFSMTNANFLGNSGVLTYFTFTTPNVPGVYTLNIENGILGNVQGQNILDETVSGTVTLTQVPGYTVTFVIKDQNQQPIPGATVTLGAITNPAGNYVFPNTLPGTYNWMVVKSGYETETGIVTVVGSNVVVTVTMTPVQIEGNVMKVLDVTAIAGDDVIINIEVFNEDNFCAFQFDIPLPAGFGYVPNSIHLNPARIVNHQVMANVLPNTNIFRAVAFSMTNANFLGNDGVLTYFTFSTPEVPGVYTLNIENGILGNVQGQNILDETISGTVTLISGALYTITFDVKDQNQQPIPGATVTLGSVTNPAGNYVFPNIAPGTYGWVVTKSGYETVTGAVTVVDGDVTVPVTMIPIQVTGNIMKVLDATAVAGDNVVINIEVINEDNFCAFQFDIPLPAGFGYVPNSIYLNPARIVNHQVMANVLPNTNIFRAVAFSMTNANFLGNSGVLTYFTFTTPNVPGVYTLNIENGILGNIQGQNILDETISGTVTLTQVPGYTVTFVIKDQNQQPIPGATVTLGAITNPAGNYVFPNTLPGTYNWMVVKSGYETETGIVTVVGSNVVVTVTMTPVQIEGNVMKVLDVTAIAGDDVIINIEVFNEDDFCAFQFDIPLPTGFGYVQGSIGLNPARIVNHQVMANVLPNTNIFRAVAFSMTNANFLGNDGVLTYFTFTTPEVPGVYTLNIENGILGNIQGQNILDETISGTVTLISGALYTVTFDVKDQNQQPIPGATVTLGSVTNPAGNYVFPNIAPGTYGWVVTKSGFETVTGAVTVVDGDITVPVTMIPIQISGNIMKVLDVTAEAGDDVVVEIEVINEDEFCAFQFDIPLPAGFGYVQGSIGLNPARITNHQVMANVLPNTNIFRAVAFSMTNASFLGNSGVLTFFTLTTPNVPGVYTLNIENAILGNIQGQNILDGTVSGTVTLTEPIEGNIMKVVSTTAIAGDDVLINIEVFNEDEFCAFQFDIPLPAGFGYVQGSIGLNPARITNHQVMANVLPNTNIFRAVAFSMTNASFLGNSGVLTFFTLTTPNVPGVYTLNIENAILGNIQGQNILDGTISGTVTLVTEGLYTVTFDIKNPNQVPIPGATVTLGNITNPAGNYVFPNMAPGSYFWTVVKEGYEPKTGVVYVVNANVTVPVILTPTQIEGNAMMILDATGYAGDHIVVHMAVSNEDAFTSFQFDIPMPQGFNYLNRTAVLNPARKVDHQVTASVLPNTNIFRTIGSSPTNKNFLGNSGIVVSWVFTTPLVPGVYTMNIENAVLENTQGQNILDDVYSGTVTLIQAESFRVTFIVKDNHQVLVPDATITLGSVTNPAGNYIFQNIAPGTYNWTVSKAGYEIKTGVVKVVDRNVIVNVTIMPVLYEGNVMIIPDAVGYAGERIVVHMAVYNDDPFVSFQFDIPLPQDFDYLPRSIVLNPARITNHQVIANVIPNTNIFRANGFSPTNMEFLGDYGIIASWVLETPSIPGVYNLNLDEAVLYNIHGQNILSETQNGTVTLVAPEYYSVTFDVRDQNQVVVPGATVALGQLTNPAGNYVFPNILPGTYNWTVAKEGYSTESGQVTVVDENVTVHVTLTQLIFPSIVVTPDSVVHTIDIGHVDTGEMTIANVGQGVLDYNIGIQYVDGLKSGLMNGNVMKVLNVTADPGEEVLIEVAIDNVDQFVAFQFDIVLPNGFTYVPNSTTLNPERSAGHQAHAAILPNTNTYRALAFSMQNAYFLGNSGVVLSFKVIAPDTPGAIYPFNLTNALISNINAQNIITGVVNGVVTMTGELPGNYMLIGDVAGQAGSVQTIDVIIRNIEEFVAFQADIILPEGFDYIPGSLVLNGDRAVDHVIETALIPGTNDMRIVAYSMTNAEFLGTDGAVASFQVSTPVTSGSYTIEIENAIIVSPMVTNIITGTYNGTVLLEEGWLSVSPMLGSVAAGDIDDLILTFDATNLQLGDYFAKILVNNNDPNNPLVVVPVNLLVVDGVNELEKEVILVYPVPASDVLNISTSKGINVVRMYNHAGQMVYENNNASANSLLKVDVSRFTTGGYVLEFINANGKIHHKKILISR